MLSFIPLLLIAIPIGLTVVGGDIVRKRGNQETAEQQYFLFLIWTVIGLLTPALINWIFPRLNFDIGMLLIPIVPAVAAMILLHSGEWHNLQTRQKRPILFAILLLAILTIVKFWIVGPKDDGQLLVGPIFLATSILSITVFLFAAWKWGNLFPFLFGVVAIFYLTLFNVLEMGSLSLPLETTPGWQIALGFLAYLTIPGFVIPVMAVLTVNVLGGFSAANEARPVIWRPIIGRSILALILLGYILYTYVWLWIWDGSDDGIRGLFMIVASVMTAISAGTVMVMTISGWRRWTSLVFVVLVTVPLYLAVVAGTGMEGNVSNYTVTEDRAMHIQKAIESHRSKTGWYPLELKELTPGALLRIPLPMIVPGQSWCYQAGPNYYRLGLVYREHWSSPYFSVRVYATAGDIPDGGWECDGRLAEVTAKYQAGFNEPPASSPFPESSIPVQRTYVEPILSGKSFSVGDWSPDGRYLVFGKTEYFMDEVEQVKIDLHFIDSTTGSICQPPESAWTVKESDGLRGHYAWLSDGRFLYVTDVGEMWTFKPCASDTEDLSSHYSNTFTGILSFDENTGKTLLKDEGGLWLLNGSSLEVRKIADIPVESYRDFYAWSADGKRLAISILTAAEEGEPAFLYVVNTESGEVEFDMPIQDVSDANLPIVEWLAPDDLLLHSKTLTVLDFRTNLPAMTDLIHDVFLLDIEYPNDISSMDSHPGMDGYTIGVRVNHPNNHGVYLYESATGQVTVYEHDTNSLFFFPDGGWMRLFEWEDEPSYTDEYEMIWMNQPGDARRLVVEGHVPRSQPQMFPRYLPDSSQLIFSSSQGISLVSIPSGETVRFWSLRGAEQSFSEVYPSPMENAVIVFAGEVGLYYLPLSSN